MHGTRDKPDLEFYSPESNERHLIDVTFVYDKSKNEERFQQKIEKYEHNPGIFSKA